MTRLAVFICSFGYVGFFPVAPGTAGSAAGIAVYLAIRDVASPATQLAFVVALFVVGVILTKPCEESLNCVDPGPIVIDEVMGMLLTLFMNPVGWVGLLLAFILFRALDVAKPFPARQLERLPAGLGVMSDDAMAAVYANLLLRAAGFFAPALML